MQTVDEMEPKIAEYEITWTRFSSLNEIDIPMTLSTILSRTTELSMTTIIDERNINRIIIPILLSFGTYNPA